MNNYHNKQKEKNSFKSSIKRFNALFEIDTNLSAGYFYIPPSTAKNPTKVKFSEQLETSRGIFVIDFDENSKIIGFEIVNGENLDLQGIGIQETKGINRGEIDGNK